MRIRGTDVAPRSIALTGVACVYHSYLGHFFSCAIIMNTNSMPKCYEGICTTFLGFSDWTCACPCHTLIHFLWA